MLPENSKELLGNFKTRCLKLISTKRLREYKSRVADLQKDVEKTLQEPDKSPIPTSEDEPFNLELPSGVVSGNLIDSLPPATNEAASEPEEN